MIKLVDLAIIALCIYNKLPGVEITCTCKLTTKEQYIMIFKRSYMQDYIISLFLFLYDESIYYTFSQSFTVTTVTYTPYKFFCDKCNYIQQVPSSKFCNQKENWQKLSLIVCAIKAVQFETTLPLLKVLANGSKLY